MYIVNFIFMYFDKYWLLGNSSYYEGSMVLNVLPLLYSNFSSFISHGHNIVSFYDTVTDTHS